MIRKTGGTNHSTLFDQLRRSRSGNERVLLVTFNYDAIIETALAEPLPATLGPPKFTYVKRALF
jgi:hypothetical protein